MEAICYSKNKIFIYVYEHITWTKNPIQLIEKQL